MELNSDEQSFVTSLNWSENGNHLAIATNSAETQIWDIEKNKKIRTMYGHDARISSLSWNENILSSGSRDSYIINHDVRIKNDVISKLKGHKQEVCNIYQ
jgi:WD40 repeat protein